MQKKYPNDVVAISFNVDHDGADAAPSDELRREVLAKLTELKMETTNLIATDSFDSVLSRYELFSLPAAIVFGPDGKQLQVFEGDLNYEKQIFPLVETLLAPATAAPSPAEENPAPEQ